MMISDRAARAEDTVWELMVALAASDGSGSHPHARRLAEPDSSARDLCDAVHLLCAVHGHPPGMAAYALGRHPEPDAQAWLATVARAFAAERALVVRVSSIVGPQPSTPGQAATEATIASSRHAMEMLARSERRGCATGAIAALVLDWSVIRAVVDQAVARSGLPIEPTALPPIDITAAALEHLDATTAVDRAMTFGAQQLFHQHRGLWDLLEARAAARDRH